MPLSRKSGRFLKKLDGFAAPVKMYVHRNNPDMKGQEPIHALGSKFGGVMSVIYYCFMIYYTLTLLINMYSAEKDSIQSKALTNRFVDEFRYIELTKENFMPHFEISKLDPNVDPKSFDVWADKAATMVDISKLRNYIEILIDIQTIVSSK